MAEQGRTSGGERPRPVDLALQGGGSHGAFTWGVLDRLLSDERIAIGGLSGTSAGAMNAVVLAGGYVRGGRDEARQRLRAFWEDIGTAGSGYHYGLTPYAALFEHWQQTGSPLQRLYDITSRLLSPYQLNPFNLNPLRAVLERHADFDALSLPGAPRLFLCATNVRTGRHRIFRNGEIGVDAVLASACLPVLFRATEIDGEHYWDGGYTSNPALLPLIAESEPRDLLLVQINPVERPRVPRQAHEIIDRINEISFNASLNQELRTLALIKRALGEAEAAGRPYHEPLFERIAALNLHRIEAQKEMSGFGAASKLNPHWPFLERLWDIGHAAAARWLDDHFGDLGRRSTIDAVGDYADVSINPPPIQGDDS